MAVGCGWWGRRRGVRAREERSYGLPASTFVCEQSTLTWTIAVIVVASF